MMFEKLLSKAINGDRKAIARCISYIENEIEGYENLLEELVINNIPIIGITGPPGAGKSTVTDKLIALLVENNKQVAVICIDPSSPFHHGALLGDRIRMIRWHENSNVFIRSIASKATLGGLCPKIIEVSDFLKACKFDYIIIETIGVGQNEIEIANLADITVVVLVPEAGDEIQTMKAGLMEIADIFVINKSDRLGGETFAKNLRSMLHDTANSNATYTPVIKTIANKNEGIVELKKSIEKFLAENINKNKINLYSQKIYSLLVKKRMKDITIEKLQSELTTLLSNSNFNIYSYLKNIK